LSSESSELLAQDRKRVKLVDEDGALQIEVPKASPKRIQEKKVDKKTKKLKKP
jgi:hypothetical protein